MGEVVPFPQLYNASTVERLKKDNCKVRFNITVDPETALEILVAIGYVDAKIEPGSIVIVRPDANT
ncbi:hypothetical protein [Mesorhizobium sp. YM1C-6-2]|uniref:hypothetical protein n=1 Tax=Mesorhizobium sp. YM1C-6-2 TaxID=1827501 RepID=UPI0011C400C1|nr:hypothetical protein [Mesorhizobium sp. YM1C-6-2]